MRQLLLILLACLMLIACGKKPGRLSPILAGNGLSQPYPKVQEPPPVTPAPAAQ